MNKYFEILTKYFKTSSVAQSLQSPEMFLMTKCPELENLDSASFWIRQYEEWVDKKRWKYDGCGRSEVN